MKQTHYLSAEEKETGFHYLKKHTIWNGVGFSFLTETIIYLMALHFGASNMQLGYISSTLFLSGLILLVVPHLLGGALMKNIYFWGWLFRGLVCLSYLSLFFLKEQAAVWVILITYTLFCVSRHLGVAAAQPVNKTLMTSSNEGSRLIQLSTLFNRSSLISRSLSFAFLSLSLFSGIEGLIILTFLGVLVNTISSLYLRKIPSRERVEKTTGSQGIFHALSDSLKDKHTRLYLAVLWLFMIINVLNGFVVPFLRKEGGLAPNLVFLYSVLAVAGGLLSNIFIKPYIDKTGSKPLLILTSLIQGALFFTWALIAPTAGLFIFLPLGIIHSFFMTLGFNLTNRLFYKVLPKDRNRLTFSSMNSFTGAIIALLTGLGAGKIADFTQAGGVDFTHTYGIVFLIAGSVSLIVALTALFLNDQGSITVREASELIFLSRNRRAFLWTYQLATTEDPKKRESTLLSLEKSRSNLADREMENQLNSPYSWEKERILRSLYNYPRPSLAPMVKAEASDRHSYNRTDALFALASYPGEDTEAILQDALKEEDPLIASNALKSLIRLDKEKYAPLTAEVYPRISCSSRAMGNWFIACCEGDERGRHLAQLFTLASPDKGYRYQQLLFCLAARYYGRELLLAPFYKQSNARPGEGLAAFLEEMRDQELFHRWEWEITKWFEGEEGDKLLKLMQENLPWPKEDTPARYLRDAVKDLKPELINRSSFLALLYFSYQILRSVRKEEEKPG
ncbi:MAG: MFS transporter [Spirochaetales bacterium]|nr:MFS transporter [Spirochaetales bacterium]